MHTTTVPTAHFKVCGLPHLTVIHCLHIVHAHNYCSNYPLQTLQLTASNTDLLSTNSTCTQLLFPLPTSGLPSLPAWQHTDCAGGLHAAKGVGGADDVLSLVEGHGLWDLHCVQ